MRANFISLASIAAALALLSVLYLVLPPPSDHPGFLSDSVRYLFMAEYFGPSPDQFAQQIFWNSVFPPLFPIAIWAFGNSPGAAHSLSAALILASAIPFFFWLKRELDTTQSVLVTTVAWCSPLLVSASLDILSESLFLFWLFIAFQLSRHTGRRDTAIALAFTIACAILTRSAGVALVPAFLAWLWSRRSALGSRSSILSITVLAIPIGLWQAYKLLRPMGTGDGYLLAWNRRFEEGGWSLAETVSRNLEAMTHSASNNGGLWLCLALALLAAPTVADGLRRRTLDSLFVVAYLLIVLVWPFPVQMERFLLILAPLLLAYSAMTVYTFLPRIGWSAVGGSAALASIVFLAFLPANLHHVARLGMQVAPELEKYKRNSEWTALKDDEYARQRLDVMHRLSLAHAQIATSLGPNDCVYATLADLVAYDSRRRTLHMPLAVKELTACRYVFASILTRHEDGIGLLFPLSVRGFEDYSPVWASMDEHNQLVAALLELKPGKPPEAPLGDEDTDAPAGRQDTP